MKLRTIIVDDERLARARLRRMLGSEANVEILAECPDGASAVEAVREYAPDLMLLDIQMPGMDGFDVVDALGPQRDLAVVFVTAFDEHAVHAFEECALDYLLKPASPERLAKTLARVRRHLALSRGPVGQPPAESSARDSAEGGSIRFSVRSGQRTSFVSTDELDWIEADGNYAILHVGAQGHLLRETMSALEAKLPARGFLRVSRSAILNLRRVKELQAGAAGHHAAILQDGSRIPITRSVREVEERLRSL